jgi:hypothetical protein
MLTEPFDVFLNQFEFASNAVLPDGRAVSVIFDEGYDQLLQEVFEGRQILAYGLTSDLDSLRHGQIIVVDGRSFTIDERRPQDDGKFTELLLRE